MERMRSIPQLHNSTIPQLNDGTTDDKTEANADGLASIATTPRNMMAFDEVEIEHYATRPMR